MKVLLDYKWSTNIYATEIKFAIWQKNGRLYNKAFHRFFFEYLGTSSFVYFAKILYEMEFLPESKLEIQFKYTWFAMLPYIQYRCCGISKNMLVTITYDSMFYFFVISHAPWLNFRSKCVKYKHYSNNFYHQKSFPIEIFIWQHACEK